MGSHPGCVGQLVAGCSQQLWLIAQSLRTLRLYHGNHGFEIGLYNNLDSTCILIGLQVCYHSAVKHENDMGNMVDCLQVKRIIYSFMKETKVYIRASYIVFLFVKTENNNFKKEIKHVFRALIVW